MNAADAQAKEVELMQNAVILLDGKLVDEVVAQGHHLTGAFEASLHGTVLNTGIRTEAIGEMFLYGVYLNLGVSAERIPYGGAPTGATASKYIEALKNYWILRGLSEKAALSAAFATAKKQKVEGMPTTGSYAFSSTGERKTFIQIVDEKVTPELNDLISNGLDLIVDELFHQTESETI